MDFGIALREKVAEGIAGTLEYMAPELLQGALPNVATDLYSVGVLACQLFTGSLPYKRREPGTAPGSENLSTGSGMMISEEAAVFLEGQRGSPSNPGVGLWVLDELDAPLREVLARLLASEPAERYPDALDVLRELAAATGLPLSEETAQTRESFLQAASLVGRDQELALLTNAFRSARSGRGGFWLLGGESGVGKSRLVDELRTVALVRGARVLRGQTVREGGGPFHVLREVLERICLDVPLDDQALSVLLPILPRLRGLLQRVAAALPTVDPQSMQERALATIGSVFALATQDGRSPLVLLLEDLHWAGKESMAVLARLASLAPQRALLILGTYRDDEAPGLPEAIPDAQVLKVKRLDGASTAALCASMLGESGRSGELGEFLHRESEGNPFFIVEILRALAEEAGELRTITQRQLPAQILTGGVRAVLDRRIGHLPDWAHPLLELAAVAGRQLDLLMLAHSDSAAALAGHSLDDWLMRCASMSLLELRDQCWRFSHDKLRECVLGRLAAGGQLALRHHEAASALERAYSEAQRDEHIVRLAHHYVEAGPLVPAAHVHAIALRAAAREMQQLSFDEAARLLERVQSTTAAAALDAPRRYELFLVLGKAHIRAGDHERGKAACLRAAALARELGDAVRLAQAAVTYGSEFSLAGVDTILIELLTEALRGLAECDHPLRARALARLSACLQPAPNPDLPVAMAREAVAMARRLGDPEVLRQTLIPACSALVTFGPPQERLELHRESVLLSTRALDRVQAQRGNLRLVFDYAELGDLAGLDASIRAYEEGARGFRHPQYQWPALMMRALRAQMAGGFAECEKLTEDVRKLGERNRDFNAVFTAKMHRLTLFYTAERHAELLAVDAELQPTIARIFAQQPQVQKAIRAWILSRAGLREPLRELLTELRRGGELLQNRMFLPFVTAACYDAGDAVFAGQMYERLQPLGASFWPVHLPVSFALFPPITQSLGLLAMTLGRWDAAVAHLQDALDRSASIGLRSHLARLRCECALALRGRANPGDGERAQALLGQARELALELGQGGLLRLPVFARL